MRCSIIYNSFRCDSGRNRASIYVGTYVRCTWIWRRRSEDGPRGPESFPSLRSRFSGDRRREPGGRRGGRRKTGWLRYREGWWGLSRGYCTVIDARQPCDVRRRDRDTTAGRSWSGLEAQLLINVSPFFS